MRRVAAMQFEVQAVKLPSPICEKNAVISCQVQNESSTQQDTLHNFASSRSTTTTTTMTTTTTQADAELITPKKITNPCLDSFKHQNLHKELLFNNKIGKNVLNQKSELRRALEKHKDAQQKKEQMLQKEASKTVFERAIEERARKIESMEKSAELESEKPEFLQVHAKLCSKTMSKSS